MLVSVVQPNDSIFVYCEMATTVSLVNTHHHTWLQNFFVL